MSQVYHDGETPVNTSANDTEKKPASEGDITLSPFYHSSVNEITQPDRYVAMSRYFVLRWQRDLGPTGTAIVLHLRAECFSNRKTGELRDTKQTTVQAIADGIGVSEKTVRREFDSNKSLAKFVRVQREFAQDAKRGGFRNAPSTYRVSMDDPLHPADDLELTAIVRRKAQGADKSERGPETALDRARRQAAQFGVDASDPASGQNDPASPAVACGQNDRTQNEVPQRPVNLAQDVDNLAPPPVKMTGGSGQNDRALNHDSETTKEITLEYKQYKDTQAGAESQASVVVDSLNSLVWEDQNEDAVMEALKLEAEATAMVSEETPVPAPVPAPEPAPAPEPTPPPAPPQVLRHAVLRATADTDRAVRRAAGELAAVSGLDLVTLEDHIAKMRADGVSDLDIARILDETATAALSYPEEKRAAVAVGTIRNKVKDRAQAQTNPQDSLEAKITDKLADLPTVHAADLDAIRGRFQALDEGDRKEITRRASLLLRDAAGSEAAYKAVPDHQYRALMARVKPAIFLATEQAGAARPTREAAAKAAAARKAEIAAFREEKDRQASREEKSVAPSAAKPVVSNGATGVAPSAKRIISAVKKAAAQAGVVKGVLIGLGLKK